jgi:hypothetical protein
MKNEKAERVIALFKVCIDALLRVENVPDSTMNGYTSVEERRELRRKAKRLRKGQLHPVHENIFDGPSLADVCEATAKRDDAIDQAREEFRPAERELGQLASEGDSEVDEAIAELVAQMAQEAREGGPGSEAERRFQCLQLLGELGMSQHNQQRRRSSNRSYIVPRLTRNPLTQARMEAAAAEILESLPLGEPVWAFPAEESRKGEERLILRIGVEPVWWIGTFERGNKVPSTVQLMPGDAHFFVSAAGAGYIIEAKTRTLVEKVGDDVVSVRFDDHRLRFFVNHDDRRLEGFGPFGSRLWKTEDIGAAGFRGLTLNGNHLAGEAQQSPDGEWSAFSVDVATGEVGWEGDTRRA